MSKCPPFEHFEQQKHVKSLLHENLGKFQLKLRPADAMTFFAFPLILGGKLGIWQGGAISKGGNCPPEIFFSYH